MRAQLVQIHAMEMQAAAAKQTAEATAQATAALEEQRKAMLSAGGSIRDFVDKQRATAGTSVSPTEAFSQAQAQLARDLALARGGDTAASQRITGTAERALTANDQVNGNTAAGAAFREWVLSSLERLPATKSYDQQILEALQALGGSVNVEVELTAFRVITEQLSALSDADQAQLTQSQTVLRTVEERIGRFLTDVELSRLVDAALIERTVEQSIGRDLSAAERVALVQGGDVLRSIEQQIGRALTVSEAASLVQGGDVLRTITQQIGRNLTASEAASLVQAGMVVRVIGQYIGRDLSTSEAAAIVAGGSIERVIVQALGRDLTATERAGLVSATTVIRSVEQQLGRTLTAAEQAQIILPGSVTRTIGQTVGAATGSTLIAGGSVARTVTQAVETTETVQISRSIDDKLSGILNSIKGSTAGMNTLLSRAVDGDGIMVRTRPTGDPRQWVAFAGGGRVYGPGTDTSDDVAAWLSRDEWVINASSVRMAGDAAMAALNDGEISLAAALMLRRSGQAPRFAAGGQVGGSVTMAVPTERVQMVTVPITPMVAASANDGSRQLIAEVRRLNDRIGRLERTIVDTSAAAAEHVVAAVDENTAAVHDAAQAEQLTAHGRRWRGQ